MTALPTNLHQLSCASRISPCALAGMLLLAFVIFFSSGVSAFLQGDREFTHGPRTVAGEVGNVKASFREALLYSKRLLPEESAGAEPSDNSFNDLLWLLSGWPASAFTALQFHHVTTARALPRLATVSLPGNPQAPPR